MTLKRKMLLIIIPAIIIIIGFVSYYVIKKNDNQLRDLMKTEARYRGSSIKNGIEVATESTEKVAEALAVSIDIESDFNEDFIIKLIAANSKFFFNIQSCNICFLPNEVGFKTKEFIFNFDNNTFKLIKHNEKQITYLDKPWFLEPIKTDKPFWCDPYTTKDRPNDTKISYIVPIKRNNKNIGVITLNFLTIFIDIELERERQKILKKNQYLSDDTDIFMIATPEENKKNQVYRIIADSVFFEKSRIDKLLSENNILLKTIKETDQSISDTNQVQKISDFIIKYIVNYEPPENKTKTEKERKEERFNIHDIQLGNKIILSIPILDDLRLYTSGINNNKKKIVWYILIISSNEKANKEIQNAVIQTLLITLAILFLLIFIIVKTLDNSLKPISELVYQSEKYSSGDFSNKLSETSGTIEINRLSMAFNKMGKDISQMINELIDTQKEIVSRLSIAAEYRDEDTGMHIKRISKYAEVIAKAYQKSDKTRISDKDIALLSDASQMHDVGKIGIPDNILLKPGKLDEEEFKIMKSHTVKGGEILSESNSDLIRMSEIIALNHHEKWDGTGYPNGKKHDDIPIIAQITSICDVFDALTTRRPYKKAWSIDEAVAEIQTQSGKAFDPKLVIIFRDNLPEILKIKDMYKDE